MRKLEQFALSIQHYFQSRGKYRLHSDLAYRLYTEVHKEQKKASQTTGILHGLMNYPPTEKRTLEQDKTSDLSMLSIIRKPPQQHWKFNDFTTLYHFARQEMFFRAWRTFWPRDLCYG